VEHHWSNELLRDCVYAAKALKRMAHSRGFEPLTFAFGVKKTGNYINNHNRLNDKKFD